MHRNETAAFLDVMDAPEGTAEGTNLRPTASSDCGTVSSSGHGHGAAAHTTQTHTNAAHHSYAYAYVAKRSSDVATVSSFATDEAEGWAAASSPFGTPPLGLSRQGTEEARGFHYHHAAGTTTGTLVAPQGSLAGGIFSRPNAAPAMAVGAGRILAGAGVGALAGDESTPVVARASPYPQAPAPSSSAAATSLCSAAAICGSSDGRTAASSTASAATTVNALTNSSNATPTARITANPPNTAAAAAGVRGTVVVSALTTPTIATEPLAASGSALPQPQPSPAPLLGAWARQQQQKQKEKEEEEARAAAAAAATLAAASAPQTNVSTPVPNTRPPMTPQRAGARRERRPPSLFAAPPPIASPSVSSAASPALGALSSGAPTPTTALASAVGGGVTNSVQSNSSNHFIPQTPLQAMSLPPPSAISLAGGPPSHSAHNNSTNNMHGAGSTTSTVNGSVSFSQNYTNNNSINGSAAAAVAMGSVTGGGVGASQPCSTTSRGTAGGMTPLLVHQQQQQQRAAAMRQRDILNELFDGSSLCHTPALGPMRDGGSSPALLPHSGANWQGGYAPSPALRPMGGGGSSPYLAAYAYGGGGYGGPVSSASSPLPASAAGGAVANSISAVGGPATGSHSVRLSRDGTELIVGPYVVAATGCRTMRSHLLMNPIDTVTMTPRLVPRGGATPQLRSTRMEDPISPLIYSNDAFPHATVAVVGEEEVVGEGEGPDEGQQPREESGGEALRSVGAGVAVVEAACGDALQPSGDTTVFSFSGGTAEEEAFPAAAADATVPPNGLSALLSLDHSAGSQFNSQEAAVGDGGGPPADTPLCPIGGAGICGAVNASASTMPPGVVLPSGRRVNDGSKCGEAESEGFTCVGLGEGLLPRRGGNWGMPGREGAAPTEPPRRFVPMGATASSSVASAFSRPQQQQQQLDGVVEETHPAAASLALNKAAADGGAPLVSVHANPTAGAACTATAYNDHTADVLLLAASSSAPRDALAETLPSPTDGSGGGTRLFASPPRPSVGQSGSAAEKTCDANSTSVPAEEKVMNTVVAEVCATAPPSMVSASIEERTAVPAAAAPEAVAAVACSPVSPVSLSDLPQLPPSNYVEPQPQQPLHASVAGGSDSSNASAAGPLPPPPPPGHHHHANHPSQLSISIIANASAAAGASVSAAGAGRSPFFPAGGGGGGGTHHTTASSSSLLCPQGQSPFSATSTSHQQYNQQQQQQQQKMLHSSGGGSASTTTPSTPFSGFRSLTAAGGTHSWQLRLADLDIIGPIDSGASATVFKARHRDTQKTFAVKRIDLSELIEAEEAEWRRQRGADSDDDDEGTVDNSRRLPPRLRQLHHIVFRELQMLHSQYRSAHVLKLYDAFFDHKAQTLDIAMEYMHWGSLVHLGHLMNPHSKALAMRRGIVEGNDGEEEEEEEHDDGDGDDGDDYHHDDGAEDEGRGRHNHKSKVASTSTPTTAINGNSTSSSSDPPPPPRKVRAPLPERFLAVVAEQILHGLRDMHSKGHVHRDIKPGNVLVNSSGVVKLSDFGLVESVSNIAKNEGDMDDDALAFCSGTDKYMAPERQRGEPHGPPSDVWALGMTLAECAVGRYPVDIASARDAFERIDLMGRVRYPPTIGLSRDFRDFVEQCMRPDAAQRPTAAELLDHPLLSRWEGAYSLADRLDTAVKRQDAFVEEAKANARRRAEQQERADRLMDEMDGAGEGYGYGIYQGKAKSAKGARARGASMQQAKSPFSPHQQTAAAATAGDSSRKGRSAAAAVGGSRGSSAHQQGAPLRTASGLPPLTPTSAASSPIKPNNKNNKSGVGGGAEGVNVDANGADASAPASVSVSAASRSPFDPSEALLSPPSATSAAASPTTATTGPHQNGGDRRSGASSAAVSPTTKGANGSVGNGGQQWGGKQQRKQRDLERRGATRSKWNGHGGDGEDGDGDRGNF